LLSVHAKQPPHTIATSCAVSSRDMEQRTLAVLFIVIDSLPFARIWQSWSETEVRDWKWFVVLSWPACVPPGPCVGPHRPLHNVGSSSHDRAPTPYPQPAPQVPPGWRVRFWVHAKSPEIIRREAEDASAGPAPSSDAPCSGHDPASQRWVRDRMLPVTFRPTWGSVELVRAALELVRTALEDSSVQFLALASESCLPMQPLAQVRVPAACTWFRSGRSPSRPPPLQPPATPSSPPRHLNSSQSADFCSCSMCLWVAPLHLASPYQCVAAVEADPRSWLLYDLPRSRHDFDRKSSMGRTWGGVCGVTGGGG
jgi:hypothetical protein